MSTLPVQTETVAKQELNICTVLADKLTPVLAFERLRAESQYGFLLESSEQDSRLARFSILGIDPRETLIFKDHQVTIQHCLQNGERTVTSESCDDPLKFLEQRTKLHKQTLSSRNLPDEIPFAAGYVGYLGYGSSNYFDGIEQQEIDKFKLPEAIFSFYDALLVFDHKERLLRILSYRGKAHAESLLKQLQSAGSPETVAVFESQIDDAFKDIMASMKREDFLSKVAAAKSYIAEGQVFQIVLAQRFEKKYSGDPFKIYRALQSINPSPYGYFLQFPEFSYLGASPERLLKCRNGEISLTALAGTRPRGKNEVEEKAMEEELSSNEKELAEHYMLVDLGRNDLGRVGEAGSVICGEIARISKYGQVMHLSTDISARLSQDKSSFDAVRSCFPAGTVSGAPKIRAMELLAKLEPERRGIYSGLVGYFDLDGNVDSAIAIRSALVKDGLVHVSAGAGIVQDSIASDEYEETRNKALSILKAVRIAEGF